MKGVKLFVCLLAGLLLFGCNEYTPKPFGYPRIERLDTVMRRYQAPQFSFLYSDAAKIIQLKPENKEELWFNISYPAYDATIYCTYIPITKETLRKALDDSYRLAYNHASKAEEITQSQFANSQRHTSAIIYEIKGSVAVPIQFFVTDSVSNFLRGSLYYNQTVNPDSVAPVTRFIRDDIVRLIESFEWANVKTGQHK